jgi:hypothetical protein
MRKDLVQLRQALKERERKGPLDADDDGPERVTVTRANLPTLPEVLYTEPDDDGRRRTCGTCRFWEKPDRCSLMPEELPVPKDAVCGYWVGEEPLEPKLAGLTRVPDGASCDNCVFYEARTSTKGLCHAVTKNEQGDYALVHPRGCCTRWSRR